MDQALLEALNGPEDNRRLQDLWDVKRVKEALVDAFLIYERTGGRIGPRGMKSSWTPFAADPVDIWEQRRSGTNEVGRRARVQVTIARIERAEMVIEGGESMAGWLRGPLDSYPLLKRHLTMWVMREVHNEMGRDPITIEQMCKRRGLKLSTFNRHVKDGAYMVADRLNRMKIEVW
ncbi:MAG: hypothetical protein P4M09_16985 [Devosia sp.]|nr:hypothetical protein [Devosia sp.]